MTKERVPDALFLPSSLFSADAGVIGDMAYQPAETPLLTLAKAAAAGRWHLVMGIDSEVPSERGVQDSFCGLSRVCLGRLVSGRVKLGAAPSQEKTKSRVEVEQRVSCSCSGYRVTLWWHVHLL
jgi:hypothetical protein